MNPQFHDEFVALCALYHSGDISEEEWALLQIHMAYCDACHEHFKQFEKITSDVIPALAGAAAADMNGRAGKSAHEFDAAEKRLMSRLDSVAVPEEISQKQEPSRHMSAGLIAAGIAAIACAVGAYVIHGRSPAPVNEPPRVVAEAPQPKAANPPAENVDETSEIAELQRQLATSEQKLRASNEALSSAQKQAEADQVARQRLSDERAALSTQLATAQTEAQTLRDQLASATSSSSEQNTRVASLESTVRELRASLDDKNIALQDKDRMLELDKDFLAHDRDIRDVMGARNLYIADITDTNEDGKAARQFGRIFYTKDRSLIFYGFDLDSQAGRNRDVSFQVWGSGSDRQRPVSLGLFYQDDTHKRWELRCNDAKTLARLDMVFVTVEPPGGSSRPTGKQLLRAYLQIHPNHP